MFAVSVDILRDVAWFCVGLENSGSQVERNIKKAHTFLVRFDSKL